MRFYNASIIAVFFSCGVIASDNEFSIANEKWKAQSQLKNPERMKYLEKVLEIDNGKGQDEQGGCYYLGKGGITQIVTINSEGVVESVVSEPDNEKSKCFKKVYLGLQYPKPPFAPIYDKMFMGYSESN